MSEPANTPISKRSELMRFLRWVSSWRGIRRILIVLAWTATIIPLLYAEENWRGRRTWNNYRQQLIARGIQLDLASFIPKPVPDEQNFAANPFIESWFLQKTGMEKRWEDDYSRINTKASVPGSPWKGERRFLNLVGWQMAYEAIRSGAFKNGQRFDSQKWDRESRAKAAPVVLEALKASETNLAALRATSNRPYSRYPVVYDLENPWGILLPHLPNLQEAFGRLRLRACAELAASHSDRAFDDVKLMFYLADSIKQELFLISDLVRLAEVQVTIQPLWEGLAEHRWSDAQLQEFQKQLQRYDFLDDLKGPLEGERATGILTADLLYRQKYLLSTLVDQGRSDPFGSGMADLFARLAPHGWYYQEQFNYCRLYENQLGGTFDPAKRRVFPKEIQARDHELQGELASGRMGRAPKAVLHHQLLASLLLPALGKVPLKAASAQTAVDQALLACALERYRLAKGEFPEKLEALAPAYLTQLPNDLLSGQPYKYRRLPDGQFILYSIGWDEKDDGGMPSEYFEKPGDWVWQSFPAEGK